ncbi:MAG: hypothetical protein ACLFPJ_02140 [Candidatus Woesearchaeota archaeon]
MNYIKNVIACGLVALSLSGCITQETYYTGGDRLKSKDYAKSNMVIQKNVQKINKKPSSLDELVSNLKRQEEQMDAKLCLNKYESKINRINNYIKNKNYSQAHNNVLHIINSTNRKTDKCSKDINNSLKKFTYRRHDYVEAKYKVTEKLSDDPLDYAFDLFSGITQIYGISLGQIPNLDVLNSIKKNTSEVKKAHYKIYQVSPYRKNEKFIGIKYVE